MSVTLTVDVSELLPATDLVAGLGDVDELTLLRLIGALGEDQTKQRILVDKTAPDGTPWPPNLEGTPILVRTGSHLHNSIASIAGGGIAEWGSGWEFAHVHQYGATIKPKTAERLVFKIGGKTARAKAVKIPPRPFIGLSADNRREIVEEVTDFLGLMLGGAH